MNVKSVEDIYLIKNGATTNYTPINFYSYSEFHSESVWIKFA